MAIEIVEKEQAELKGQFDQFDKRVDRMQTESDNTKRELTDSINRLFDRMDAGFADLRRDLGNTQKWQLSFIIAAVIAVCAVAGLLIK